MVSDGEEDTPERAFPGGVDVHVDAGVYMDGRDMTGEDDDMDGYVAAKGKGAQRPVSSADVQ